MTEQSEQERVVELIRGAGVAMMTYAGPDGALVSKPMATQETEFDGTIRFIAERSSDKVRALQADPRVNVTYNDKGSWVSVAGTARIVDDVEKLEELWSSFTSSWLEGGPDNPENVLIEVEGATAEYWAAPGGSTVTSLANLVKSKVTGKRIEGDNATVDLG
ncbi:pyridoxamine 5'-phosphate oxidase family protein [Marmoricola endophyticus]|uniref:pyridoxamine 5'-phosphate oxidase family protein n=1 Tax=Marmoricola endophyticus TaxID=2040280 RepID=UPI00166EABA8|nr:pyridoxamine 5'-phosphate oxidase family protein [Marmoricola endophyticus]